METTIEMKTQTDEIFYGACIDSGAQLTVIGLTQENAYCRSHEGFITEFVKPLTFRFGGRRHEGIGRLKIRVPVKFSHIIDIVADAVDVKISLLLGLNVLTQLKAILYVDNNVIMSLTIGWELSPSRKLGHLYL